MTARNMALSLSALALLTTTTALQAEPVTVTMWTQETNGVTNKSVEKFNAEQAEVFVELVSKDFSSLLADLVRAFATGNAPDILEVDNPEIAVFSSRGKLLDLTEMAANAAYFDMDAMVPGMKDAGTWDGKLYAIPKAANTIALFYNADMFEAAGLDPEDPPETWAELADYAAQLNDPENKVAGLSFSAAANEEGTFQFLPMAQMAGADYDGLDSEAGVKALQFWTDLYTSGNVIPDAISTGQWDLTGIFNAGGSAMHISGPWELDRMSKTAEFDYRVALLPLPEGSDTRSSALGEFMHGINAEAEHPEAAFAFIDWYHSQDPTLWNTYGVIPGFEVAFEAENFAQAYEVFAEQIKYASVRGPHPEWPKISKAIQDAIQASLAGQASPEDALAEAAKAIDKVLSE